jgi:hypothetical protein
LLNGTTLWRAAGQNPWLLLIAAVVLGGGLLFFSSFPKSPSESSVSLDEGMKLNQCRTTTLELMKPDKMDLTLLTDVSNFCQYRVYGEDTLGDYNVRRSSYVQQQFDTRVLLWMVVAITLSGVVLAGLQLLAGYRLASVGRSEFQSGGQGGEVRFDAKGMSVKSSVTGLLILTVSFAFFIVYVKWVYPLNETPISAGAGTPVTVGAAALGVGGAGIPPGNISAPANPSTEAQIPAVPKKKK